MFFRKLTTSFWILLIIGVAVRCVALNQPLVDAHPLRQALVSHFTNSLMEQPGIPLSGKIPWSGDLDERYMLEIPFFNYMVIGVFRLTGNLDLSGKLAAIFLWGCSFMLLQAIWRRFLDRDQTFWANVLFVAAPLEIFFGQAFMVEMLVQVVAFTLLLQMIRYSENPTLGRWLCCSAASVAAVLVKLPEMAHLFLVLGLLVWRTERWKAALRPRYLLVGILLLAVAKLLGKFIDTVNEPHMADWTAKAMLPAFIGTNVSRLEFKPWAMVAFYLGAFVCPGFAALVTAGGFWKLVRGIRMPILSYWLLSLALYYLVWFGNAGTAQNYYNLPAVGPIAALFGIGAAALLQWRPLAQRRPLAIAGLVVLVTMSVFPGTKYLFTPDKQILAAALWTREHSQPGDVILFRPNHRFDMTDHLFNPVFPYYSDRPTFVWTRNTPERYRQPAMERAKYAVVTLPPPPPEGVLGAINRFRGVAKFHDDRMEWIEAEGFVPKERNEAFIVYERK